MGKDWSVSNGNWGSDGADNGWLSNGNGADDLQRLKNILDLE